ncbi:COX15/CtaA family protein [Corynebacterium glucuronolyticum]|uniref:COX15/CtaA family protein n=1 Tax=Corynebacterium glucuronolyticum TaxID=39791 RepID=UPI003F6DD5A2
MSVAETANHQSGLRSARNQRNAAFGVLAGQSLITLTGSIVRVTGSGLGCDTWPNCHPGSLVPVQGAAPWIQQLIEFGNRTLTFVLVALTVWLLVAVYKAGRRSYIKKLAWLQLIGVFVQAVIGGISVHMDLKWYAVALHFLPSVFLVFFAALTCVRVMEPDNGVDRREYPRTIQYLALGTTAALALVLATGTMVTGAGPHAGDANDGMKGRLEVDIEWMAHIHAGTMYLFLGLIVGLLAAIFATKTTSEVARKFAVGLVAVCVLQALVGIIQVNLHVPNWTVPIHVFLSSVVTAFTGFVYAHGTSRVPATSDHAATGTDSVTNATPFLTPDC